VSDSDFSDEGGDHVMPCVEISAAFFTADQRKRMEHDLRLLRQAPTEDIAVLADGWLKEAEIRSRASLKGGLSSN